MNSKSALASLAFILLIACELAIVLRGPSNGNTKDAEQKPSIDVTKKIISSHTSSDLLDVQLQTWSGQPLDIKMLKGEVSDPRELVTGNEFDADITVFTHVKKPNSEDSSHHPFMAETFALTGGRERESFDSLQPRAAWLLPANGYDVLTVCYGTNRARSGNPSAAKYYGNKHGSLELGYCTVTVPRRRNIGELSSPGTISSFFYSPDPTKHIIHFGVTAFESEDNFVQKLKDIIDKSSPKDVFVFVHGYNVSFDDAARRTAQMAADLHLKAVPLFFSWPSQNAYLGYSADLQTTDWAASDLAEFLKLVRFKSGADRVHIITHSMGGRLLGEAATALIINPGSKPCKFNEIILTAPDIEVDTFRRKHVKYLLMCSDRITLYASSNDKALKLSRGQADGNQRLGESNPEISIFDGIESIDASAVDTSLIGHFYYGDTRSVLEDMFYLIHKQLPANSRFLETCRLHDATFWRLRP